MQQGLGTYLVYLLFLLIPGFAGLRAFHFGRVALDSMTRLDKLAAIVIGGFVSLLCVGAIYRFNPHNIPLYIFNASQSVFTNCHLLTYGYTFPNVPYINNRLVLSVPVLRPTTCTQQIPPYPLSGPIRYSTIEGLSLLTGGVVIIIQSLVAGTLGLFYGRFHRELDDNQETPEELAQPWERAYEISNIGDEVIVITTQGREIKGTIQQMGSVSEQYDILLDSPTEVSRSGNGEIHDERSLGEYTYHHYRDIARVEFRDEDLTYDPESDITGTDSLRDITSEWVEAGKKVCSDIAEELRTPDLEDQSGTETESLKAETDTDMSLSIEDE